MNELETNTASLDNENSPTAEPEGTSLSMDEILEINSEIRFS